MELPLTKDAEPYGVLAAEVDTEQTLSCVYLTGEFNKKYVGFFDADQGSLLDIKRIPIVTNYFKK